MTRLENCGAGWWRAVIHVFPLSWLCLIFVINNNFIFHNYCPKLMEKAAATHYKL